MPSKETQTISDTPAGGGFFSQPRAVWAVAFAAVVSFMGLGLVDPILPAIAKNLHASPSQVELLFTSYFAFTGISMLASSVVASRIGAKRTLLVGLGPDHRLQRAGGRLEQRRGDRRAAGRLGARATRCSSPPRCRSSSARPAAASPAR